MIYFSFQIVFVILLILLGQAKMWVRLYFLPHVAFAECLVHSDVADSESVFLLFELVLHTLSRFLTSTYFNHYLQRLARHRFLDPSFGWCFLCSDQQLYRLQSNMCLMLWTCFKQRTQSPKIWLQFLQSLGASRLPRGKNDFSMKFQIQAFFFLLWFWCKITKKFLSHYWVNESLVACLDALWWWIWI